MKNIKFRKIAIAIFILGGLVYWELGAKDLVKRVDTSTSQVFDNSIPGLWKINTKTESKADSRFNGERTVKVCVTQNMIQSSLKKSLQEKFGFEGLTCASEFTRKSNDVGKFSLECNGIDPVKKQNVAIKLNGDLISKADNSNLIINYILSSGESNVDVKINAISNRDGDCPTLKSN